jgi:hypothetical protein
MTLGCEMKSVTESLRSLKLKLSLKFLSTYLVVLSGLASDGHLDTLSACIFHSTIRADLESCRVFCGRH